ncbi:gliding motility-associated C-terminal domain-containing protein [bacterium]|nr:gliding motility-associated C-terminal domain-containing protein [bacterium]
MRNRYTWLLCLWLLVTSLATTMAQEICDNALDDDQDGLVDLNDPDCDCPVIEPISLIPNASFEEMDCCPSNRAQMDCAVDWIQASAPTTDYIHTCGWMGWGDLPVPLPIPDGEGCIGFRNGRFGNGGTNANWKEYAGACLTAPLRANVDYKFQFYIGFTHAVNSPFTNITFYGSTDCNNLPFGNGDETFGCPTNGPGWKMLGQVAVSGANVWKRVEIKFTPDEDIYAMAIGPDCILLNALENTYYFFDNLVLADEASFQFDIQPTNDNLCAEGVTLSVPHNDSLTYQWYKRGIALVGETRAELSALQGNGNYQVRVVSAGLGCRISTAYRYSRPVSYADEFITICEGDSFQVDNYYLTEAGTYSDTLNTTYNCDSILRLNLRVFKNTGDTVRAKIYPGEVYKIEKVWYAYPGEFTQVLQADAGCDSTVILFLEYYEVYKPNAFSPNGDGINDRFFISGGEDLINIPSFKIYNQWGNHMYEGKNWNPGDSGIGWDGTVNGRSQPEGVYVYAAEVMFDDGKVRVVSGSFTLLR